MDKHTSGPWTAHHGWAHDGRPLPQHPDWCEVLGGSFEHGDYMSICGHFGMANARLIAAAPDLLEALETAFPILTRLAEQQRQERGGGVMEAPQCNTAEYLAYCDARAAIAKATTE